MMRALLCSVLLLGCADAAKWSTAPGEHYCGVVTSAKFVRTDDSIAEGTKLRLELDAEHLQTSPGRLWSTDFTPTPPGEPKKPTERFDGLELRVIPQLLHDPLSTLTFGEGRVKNTILIGELRGKDGKSLSEVMIFLSLLQSGNVEVRIVRGASPGSAPPGSTSPPQLFGVFELEKTAGDCGVP